MSNDASAGQRLLVMLPPTLAAAAGGAAATTVIPGSPTPGAGPAPVTSIAETAEPAEPANGPDEPPKMHPMVMCSDGDAPKWR